MTTTLNQRRVILDEREADFIAEAIRLAPAMVLNTTRPAFEESDTEELAVRIERAGSPEAGKYAVGQVLQSIQDAAHDLEQRAKALRSFAELAAGESPATLVAPNSAFFHNVLRAFDDADRDNRVKQSRTHALQMLATAAGV